ncbi:hypothetical protein Tco_0695904 [Tanacetum coccineum]
MIRGDSLGIDAGIEGVAFEVLSEGIKEDGKYFCSVESFLRNKPSTEVLSSGNFWPLAYVFALSSLLSFHLEASAEEKIHSAQIVRMVLQLHPILPATFVFSEEIRIPELLLLDNS